jgi:hypothetical protein
MSRLPLHPPLARPPGPPRPRAVAFDPGPAIGRVDVSILKRSALSVAPETVFFRARITAPGLSEAADRGRYDESFHKPLYIWDFGDPGAVSDKVVNLPRAHNDLNRAHGKEVAHVFTRPGRHRVRCTAYAPDGALIGEDAMDVDVGDPARVFAGEQTVLLDPAGRGDPGRYPDAQVVTGWNDGWDALRELEAPGRFLLKRGTTLRLTEPLRISRDLPNAYLSAWGEGARPVLSADNDEALIIVNHHFAGDAVFRGLALRGGWDSTTETGTQVPGLMTDQTHDRTVLADDCTFTGFGITFFVRNPADGGRHGTLCALHNCDITNWGDYGVYTGGNLDQFLAFLGTAIHQHPEAFMGGGGRKEGDTNQHGPIRISHGGHTHISACDLFSRNGWSMATGIAADQPCLRWSTGQDEQAETRSSCVVERTAMEGGFDIVAVRDQNNRGPYYGTNFVMDKCLLVGTARTKGGRPCGADRHHRAQHDHGAARHADADQPLGGLGDPRHRQSRPGQNDPPTRRDLCQHDGQPDERHQPRRAHALAAERDIDLFETFSFENNLVFAPNATGQQPEDPRLSGDPMVTVGGVWSQRYLGPRYRDLIGRGAQMTLDSALRHAHRAALAASSRCPARRHATDASGRVPVDDFYGRPRSEDPERGAQET